MTLLETLQLSIKFKRMGHIGKSKPDNCDGAVIIWAVLDKPPTKLTELTQHAMATRTPYIMHFDEQQRGKRVYLAMAWQNRRGHLGAWSDMFEAVIP